MTATVTAYIGLGSNLEDPQQQVEQAFRELAALPDSRLSGGSRRYRSDPVGPAGQPDYINAVARLETRLEAHDLLDQLQAIENAHQRRRAVRWGPRTLDLDLLLYGNETIHSERLIVPHPYMAERNFVLYPLADLTADLTLPNGQSLRSLLAHCPQTGLTVLETPLNNNQSRE